MTDRRVVEKKGGLVGEIRKEKIEKIKFQIQTAFVKALDAGHFYKCHFT